MRRRRIAERRGNSSDGGVGLAQQLQSPLAAESIRQRPEVRAFAVQLALQGSHARIERSRGTSIETVPVSTCAQICAMTSLRPFSLWHSIQARARSLTVTNERAVCRNDSPSRQLASRQTATRGASNRTGHSNASSNMQACRGLGMSNLMSCGRQSAGRKNLQRLPMTPAAPQATCWYPACGAAIAGSVWSFH